MLLLEWLGRAKEERAKGEGLEKGACAGRYEQKGLLRSSVDQRRGYSWGITQSEVDAVLNKAAIDIGLLTSVLALFCLC